MVLKITVNGELREIPAQSTIAALLRSLGLNEQATVVQRNEDIVDRQRFGDTVLADGDTVELVRFVGGG